MQNTLLQQIGYRNLYLSMLLCGVLLSLFNCCRPPIFWLGVRRPMDAAAVWGVRGVSPLRDAWMGFLEVGVQGVVGLLPKTSFIP